jgi:hypothetical protein
MLSAGLECFLQGWNAFDRVAMPLYTVGMLSTGWNALDSVGMLWTVLEYLRTQLECFLQGWNAFDSVGIPLYIVGMLSVGLECFP